MNNLNIFLFCTLQADDKQKNSGLVTEVKSLKKEVLKLRKQSRNMFAMLNLMRVLTYSVERKEKRRKKR